MAKEQVVQPVPEAEPAPGAVPCPYDAVAPYLGDKAAAVFRLDVEKVDLAAAFQKGMELVEGLELEEHELAELGAGVRPKVDYFAERIEQFLQAGGREWYVVVSLNEPPYCLVPLTPGANVRAIRGLLFSGEVDGPVAGDRARTLPFHEVCEQVGDVIYAGPADRLEQLRAAQIAAPPGPKLAEAHAAVEGMTAQFLFIPTEQMYNFLEAQDAELPPELGGPVADILRELKWQAIGLSATPEARFKVVLQCRDGAAARAWQDLGTLAAETLRRDVAEGHAGVGPLGFPMMLFSATPSTLQGDRLVLELDEEKLSELIAMRHAPMTSARARAKQIVSAARVHHLLLGLTLYADGHNSQWPENLAALMPDYLADDGVFKNPRQPEGEVGYIYLRPDPMADPQAIVIYEAHDEWPQDGLVVGFADGHVEIVRDRARFEELTAPLPGAE